MTVTMRVGPRSRKIVSVELIAGSVGVSAVAITFPADPRPFTVTMDDPDWRRIVEMFGGDLPAVTPNGNGRGGRRYPRLTLPRRPGKSKGRQVMLAHLVIGTDMRGRQVKYRDGNPLNLRRDNLLDLPRGATAPGATDGA